MLVENSSRIEEQSSFEVIRPRKEAMATANSNQQQDKEDDGKIIKDCCAGDKNGNGEKRVKDPELGRILGADLNLLEEMIDLKEAVENLQLTQQENARRENWKRQWKKEQKESQKKAANESSYYYSARCTFTFGLIVGLFLYFVVSNLVIAITNKGKINETIILFSEQNHQGNILTVPPWSLNENKCYNFNKYQTDFAASIDTQGQCVYLYEKSDCRGEKHSRVSRFTKEVNLNLWGLHKNVLSIQSCCQREV